MSVTGVVVERHWDDTLPYIWIYMRTAVQFHFDGDATLFFAGVIRIGV